MTVCLKSTTAGGRPLFRLGLIALATFTLDLVAKAVASTALPERVVEILPWWRLLLVRNVGSTANVGYSFDWALHAVGTVVLLSLIVAIIQPLADRDPGAPLGMGLIVGAAIGNLASQAVLPAGVVDFLAIGPAQSAVVGNLADLALVVGLTLLLRTVCRLGRLLRSSGIKGWSSEWRPRVQHCAHLPHC